MGREACRLCGSPARVEHMYGLGGGMHGASRTECRSCGPWEISARDGEALDKESPETISRLAEKAREQSQRERAKPLVVTEGLILFCRHARS